MVCEVEIRLDFHLWWWLPRYFQPFCNSPSSLGNLIVWAALRELHSANERRVKRMKVSEGLFEYQNQISSFFFFFNWLEETF